MPQLDAATFPQQLFWLAITFTVLYLMMSRVALPRVGRIVEQRAAHIETHLRAAEAAHLQAEALIQERDRRLAEARDQAQAIVKQAIETFNRQVAEKEAEIVARITAETDAAERRILDARAAALAQIDTVARDAAGAVIGRLISVPVEAAEIDAAVARALKQAA